MMFNKLCFLLFFVSFLLNCGLHIGENPPDIPQYYYSKNESCAGMDYNSPIKNYFLNNSIYQEAPAGENLSRALNCLARQIDTAKKEFLHEQLNQAELLRLLNQDLAKNFLPDSYLAGINLFLSDEDYFTEFLFFKKAVIHLISADKVDPQFICQQPEKDLPAISKQELSDVVNFLNKLPQFFLKLEEEAGQVFDEFFKTPLGDKAGDKTGDKELFVSQTGLNFEDFNQDFTDLPFSKEYLKSPLVKIEFVAFLSDFFKTKNPSYSDFLKQELNHAVEKSHCGLFCFNESAKKAQDLIQTADNLLQPLLDSFSLSYNPPAHPETPIATSLNSANSVHPANAVHQANPVIPALAGIHSSLSQPLTLENIKSILLNIHITTAFMYVFDQDEDNILNLKELEVLSCLMEPVLSRYVASLYKHGDFFYDPKTITNYILETQKNPQNEKLDYGIYRLNPLKSDELKSLSYTELSRLVSEFLLPQIYNYLQNN